MPRISEFYKYIFGSLIIWFLYLCVFVYHRRTSPQDCGWLSNEMLRQSTLLGKPCAKAKHANEIKNLPQKHKPETYDVNDNLSSIANKSVHQVKCLEPQPRIEYLKEPDLDLVSRNCKSCEVANNLRWKMVIFVKSAAAHIKLRELIRSTWASTKYFAGGIFETIFVIAKADNITQALIDEEYRQNGDILQINEDDGYQNVVLKTLAGMQWATENLCDSCYYSSVDDDILVNIKEVQKAVDQFKKTSVEKEWPEYPIVCMYQLWSDMGSPFRNEKNKNYVSHKLYKWTTWPKFCPGGMYTTSVKVMRQLFELARYKEPLNVDDVWITGILRQEFGLTNEMVVAPKPYAATHLGGKVLNKLYKEWMKIYKTFDQKDTCRC